MKQRKFIAMLISTVLMTVCISGCHVAAYDANNKNVESTQIVETSENSETIENRRQYPKSEGNEMTDSTLKVDDSTVDAAEPKPEESDLGETEENTMKVIINGKEYTATLDQGKTAQELRNMLPFTLNMQELNGNEKYGDLPESLTQDIYSPGEIHTGDILLWGSDTLVVFYKDFPTQYSYTKIGRIDDPEGLGDAVGKGSTEVTFQ